MRLCSPQIYNCLKVLVSLDGACLKHSVFKKDCLPHQKDFLMMVGVWVLLPFEGIPFFFRLWLGVIYNSHLEA